MGKAEQARGAASIMICWMKWKPEHPAGDDSGSCPQPGDHVAVGLCVKEPVLEYRMEGKENGETVPVQAEKFTDGGKNTWIYRARISGLEPGQTYGYRIRDGKKATAWMSLKAFAGNTFKALVFPDSQSADYSAWKATAQPAWQRNPDASFFVNMGDLVDNGEDSNQWNAWFGVVEPMAEKIPVAPVMGNHETYNLNWKVRMPEGYLHHFVLPDNGREKYRNQFYSFTVGDVHFVVLNTQNTELKEWEPDLMRDQQEWFREDMARNRKTWNIVLMHKDPFQYGFNRKPAGTGAGRRFFGRRTGMDAHLRPVWGGSGAQRPSPYLPEPGKDL